jgi:hypothetical protein
MKRLALTATTLALLAAPVLANGGETFRAQGNEPSWSIRMVFIPVYPKKSHREHRF